MLKWVEKRSVSRYLLSMLSRRQRDLLCSGSNATLSTDAQNQKAEAGAGYRYADLLLSDEGQTVLGRLFLLGRSANNYFATTTWHGASSTRRSVVLPITPL
jgi:hypothetical protein